MFLSELEKYHLVMKRMKKIIIIIIIKIYGLISRGLITGVKTLFQIWWAYNRGDYNRDFTVFPECRLSVTIQELVAEFSCSDTEICMIGECSKYSSTKLSSGDFNIRNFFFDFLIFFVGRKKVIKLGNFTTR